MVETNQRNKYYFAFLQCVGNLIRHCNLFCVNKIKAYGQFTWKQVRLDETFSSIIDYIISNDADIYDSDKNSFGVYNSSLENVGSDHFLIVSFNTIKTRYSTTKATYEASYRMRTISTMNDVMINKFKTSFLIYFNETACNYYNQIDSRYLDSSFINNNNNPFDLAANMQCAI